MKMSKFSDAMIALPMVYKNHFKTQQAVVDFMTGGANEEELFFVFHEDAPEPFMVFKAEDEDTVDCFIEHCQEAFYNFKDGTDGDEDDDYPHQCDFDNRRYIVKSATEIVKEGVPSFPPRTPRKITVRIVFKISHKLDADTHEFIYDEFETEIPFDAVLENALIEGGFRSPEDRELIQSIRIQLEEIGGGLGV